jgi:hypothetical protein
MRIRRFAKTSVVALAAVMSFTTAGAAVASGGQQDPVARSGVVSGSCPEVGGSSADARVGCRYIGDSYDWSADQDGSTFMLVYGAARCLAAQNGELVLAPCNREAADQRWQLYYWSVTRVDYLSAVDSGICVTVASAGRA